MLRVGQFWRLFVLSLLGTLFISGSAMAIPSSQPKIVDLPGKCVRISTAGVDHGEKVAQKYADDLLKSDIAAFKKKRGLRSVSVSGRFRKCKFHLWFFGNEYNCTSVARVCW